jgi:glycosyltransferase involved in cell wall biosynthesis
MASVDVIVPCYNYARFLREAVESVLIQEGVDVRVLILDDASPDNTPEVAAELCAGDPRVEYRRHPKNRGHIATYNEGIDWLAADYWLLHSADDVLVPGALARATRVMDAHPEVGLTHGWSILTPDPKLVTAIHVTPEVTVQSGLEFIRFRCEGGHNLLETPTVVGRTAVQKSVGYFRAELPHTGDMDMWLRYAAHGSVAFIHAHQAYYRTHGGNMSGGYQAARDLEHVKLAFDAFFERHGHQIPDAAGLRRIAYKAIGDRAFGDAYRAAAARDDLSYRAYARLAGELDPGSRYALRWIKLRLKRVLGARLSMGLSAIRRWAMPEPTTKSTSGS